MLKINIVRNKLLISVVIMLLSSCVVRSSDEIGMFDLKYTLKYDLADSAQVESLWDDIHAISTLQGVVNRDKPRIYINYVVNSGIEIDSYWWNMYRQPGKWLHGKDTLVYNDIVQVIDAYKSEINGVVLYDPLVASTSNVASASLKAL